MVWNLWSNKRPVLHVINQFRRMIYNKAIYFYITLGFTKMLWEVRKFSQKFQQLYCWWTESSDTCWGSVLPGTIWLCNDSLFVVRIGFCPFSLQSHFFKSDRSPDVAVASMHKFPRFFSRGNRFPFPIDLINGSKKVNEGLVQSCLDCQLFNKKNSVASLHLSKKFTTHPWSTPQAIPLPNYETIPFTTYW